MRKLLDIKGVQDDGFEVQYEIVSADEPQLDKRRKNINENISEIDKKLDNLQSELIEINAEIDKLTNHADGLDYMVAVGSGIIAGLIDSFFVDDFSLENANTIGDEKTEKYVIKKAQEQGYKGDDLAGAAAFLAKKYNIAADKGTNTFGGGTQHHLRDFSHHPTPVGLFFSILTQYTCKVYGTDTAGRFTVYELKEEEKSLIGNNIAEKITFGVINWFFHMISDICGEASTIRKGGNPTGLPGPITALLKEISALPIFNKVNKDGYKEFSVWISKLFNGTLLAERDKNGKIIKKQKFDFRTEIGITELLKQQAVPVIINECIVRGFYFIRRFYMELKSNDVHSFDELKKINWKNTLPFNNRTVIRMLTISSGTMVAVDVADAAIRSGGFNASCLMKINFVGIGRFAIAIGEDISMGVNKGKKEKERSELITQIINKSNIKLYYKNADLLCSMSEMYAKEAEMHEAESDMWIAVQETQQSIDELYEQTEIVISHYKNATQDIRNRQINIGKKIAAVEEKNPGMMDEILRRLRR